VNNFRNLALWIIIALLLVALFNLFQGPAARVGRSAISFTEFNQQILADQIKEVNLAGNHDLALLDVELAQYFNIIAYQAIVWAREHIRPECREFVESLPLTRNGDDYVACHGTPTSPDSYINYHFQGKKVLKMLDKGLKLRVCFFGHTHRRALWYKDIRGKVALHPITPGKILLERGWHYLINPGSVGQPRGGSPEAAYAVFDDQEFSIQYQSVPYDVAAAQQSIIKAGLPEYLAERLAQGE